MARVRQYRGKVVVVTGASSGFGKGAAMELARLGASVVLAARSRQTIEAIARECGDCALAVPTDVSEPEAVLGLASRAIDRFGGFDAWINDAAVAVAGRFDQVPLEDHEQVIKTNLLGTLYGSYAAMKHFRERGAGVLINVASVVGKMPTPLYSSYVAAKFGVVGLCDSMRQELGGEGNDAIRVCTVMPMTHDTGIFGRAGNYTGRRGVPIPPAYDPSVTIDALVKLVVRPRDEVITGWQGKIANVLHHLIPNVVERYMAANTMRAQLQEASASPITSGNVHRPSPREPPPRPAKTRGPSS
jgi:NAD(P)-dependent dehydrogenase (short-subunit alcohol dehydrogenase family)